MDEILRVDNLKVYYYSAKRVVPAVDGVSFTLKKGEILGIVGESGCGKSTVVRGIIGLIDERYTRIEEGQVLMEGKNLVDLPPKELCRIRGKKISMIFQNPLSSLNPVYTIGSQIEEAILAHEKPSKSRLKERVLELLKLVHIPAPEMRYNDYPHQLSGGMQQRVLIAIALACNPQVIIADEPTTALDVTIQAQIMKLLKELQKETGMSMILITHDIGVVANMADRVLVMYAGQIIEEAPAYTLFTDPKHPYTRALLETVPTIRDRAERKLFAIPGMVPENYDDITGCRFAQRCPYRREVCGLPQKNFVFEEGHRARCVVMKEGGIPV